MPDGSEAAPDAVVELVVSSEPVDTVANRFREAAFLQHDNLARVLAAGLIPNHPIAYAALEPVDGTLAEVLAQQTLTPQETAAMLDQIISACAYLHGEGFVYCNLWPGSVWKRGNRWLLGDFSQLRLVGTSEPRRLRMALPHQELPPEAFEGHVTPAWDVWSIGNLLRRALIPEPDPVHGSTRARLLRNTPLPPPFDTIVTECMEPSPEVRITLEAIREKLHGTASTAAQAPSSLGLAERMRDPGGWPMRSKLILAVVIGVLLIVAIGLANGWGNKRDTPIRKEPDQHGHVILPPRPKASPLAPFTTDGTADADREVELKTPPADLVNELNTWVAATKRADMASNMACYADRVERFYNARDLTRGELEQDKEKQFGDIKSVKYFRIDKIKYDLLRPDHAVVSFDKHWEFIGPTGTEGLARSELTFRKVNQDWRITGERDLHVYWEHKSSAA